jgi:hypothetical protein
LRAKQRNCLQVSETIRIKKDFANSRMTATHLATVLDDLVASIRLEAEKQFTENHLMNVPQGQDELIARVLTDGVALGLMNVLGGLHSAHIAFKIIEEVNTRPDVLAARQPEVFPSPPQGRSKARLELAA